MVGRPYHAERDLAAVTRMWREVAWIDDTDEQANGLRDFLDCGDSLVADVAGQAESLVHRSPGTIRHGQVDLDLCAVTAVTTSHVGRRQGLASALLVETLQAAAADGAAVAALGMFEQGFYDRFGFGTGAYEHRITFDPARLDVDFPDRPPVRLSRDDSAEMHALLSRRHRGHGSVVIDPRRMFGSEMAWIEKPFALGFRADDGRLTHFVLGSMKEEHGPYEVSWLAYEEPRQLLELLGLLRSLGDQVASMTIEAEPAELQLQDIIREPLRQRRAARLAGGSGVLHEAVAELQLRILDLPACIGAMAPRTPPIEFGLRLSDPLSDRPNAVWSGVAGEYTISLAEAAEVSDGIGAALPVLDASVSAFSRLWMGVRPASSLSLTDDLSGPAGLLRDLDEAFRSSVPQAGWWF